MKDIHSVWEKALTDIELSLSKANFNTWFKHAFPIREEDGVITIGVPNEFVKEWLYTKYHKEIIRALRQHDENIRGVEYTISKKDDQASPQKQSQPIKTPENSTKELPLTIPMGRRDNLNPRYTFDTFIIGPFNELAYSASQAILNKPGIYNPLFIYGSTGIGKTHLIQAVGNTLKERFPGIHVYYTSSEKFQIDYVSALQSNKINSFKEKYRTYDVLIMDDIQFLSGKERTQEELFHLFNILYDKNKQIIFSSDKHPNYIQGLEDRLKSRFSAGMIVDVSKPEYESRMAILQAKTKEHNVEIPFEILDYIASHVEGNIRELEGILNSLLIQTGVKQRALSLADVKSLIKNNIKPKKNVAIEDIIKIIANFYSIEESLVYEKTRRKEVVRCRQVAMYLLREDFSISFPLIGRKLGGRDHTTVIHSCEKVKQDVQVDSTLMREIEQIRAMLST